MTLSNLPIRCPCRKLVTYASQEKQGSPLKWANTFESYWASMRANWHAKNNCVCKEVPRCSISTNFSYKYLEVTRLNHNPIPNNSVPTLIFLMNCLNGRTLSKEWDWKITGAKFIKRGRGGLCFHSYMNILHPSFTEDLHVPDVGSATRASQWPWQTKSLASQQPTGRHWRMPLGPTV